jgi:hypothetical protein
MDSQVDTNVSTLQMEIAFFYQTKSNLIIFAVKIKLLTMLFSESSGSKILVSSRGKTAYIGPPNSNWL